MSLSPTLKSVQKSSDRMTSSSPDRLATEYSVMLAPGSAFGYEYHLRLGVGQRPDIFAEGLKRAGECLAAVRAS